MLMAKVKEDCRWNPVTACAGAEFIKSEFRAVPLGLEGEAEANPFLETEDPVAVAKAEAEDKAAEAKKVKAAKAKAARAAKKAKAKAKAEAEAKAKAEKPVARSEPEEPSEEPKEKP